MLHVFYKITLFHKCSILFKMASNYRKQIIWNTSVSNAQVTVQLTYALRKDTFTLTNDTWCNLKFGKHHLSHINKLPPDGLEEMTQKNQRRIQKFQNQGRVIILGDWGLFLCPLYTYPNMFF